MEMFYDVAAAATAAPTPSASNTAAWSVATRFKVCCCSDNRVIFSLETASRLLVRVKGEFLNYHFKPCYGMLTNTNDGTHVTQL